MLENSGGVCVLCVDGWAEVLTGYSVEPEETEPNTIAGDVAAQAAKV